MLVLHFAAIVITFCGDYYILRRNNHPSREEKGCQNWRVKSADWQIDQCARWFNLNSDTWVEFIELRPGTRFLLLRTKFPLQNRVSTWALELTSKPWHYVWGDSSRWNSRSKYERWADVESLSVFKMSEPLNCCVSGCLNYNNYRNSSGLHYYRIPK